jgi:hypothetical protein
MLPIEPPSRLTPEPRPVGIVEPVEMLRVNGDVYSVPDAATLQRWILERRVSAEDMVSQHGMRWTAIGERLEFALFFAAADRLGQDAGAPDASSRAPFHAPPHNLPMADDEEIYVQEVSGSEGDAPTSLEPPPGAPPAGPAVDPRPTLQPHPEGDDLTSVASEPPPAVGPLDELPANLLMASRTPDDPARLLQTPPPTPFEMEARSLGLQLGPDPDTQEATLQNFQREETEAAHDPTDSFMLTGIIPGASSYGPPPVQIGNTVPVTVRPASPSVLDDDIPPRRPPARGAGPEIVIGGLFLVALLVAGVVLFTRRPPPAEAPLAGEVAAAPAPASEPPGGGEAPPPPNAEDEATRAAAQAAAMAETLPPEAGEPGAEAAAAPPPPAAVPAPEPAPARPPEPAPAPAAKPAPRPVAERPTASRASAPAKPAAASGGSARSLSDAGWKAIDKGDIEGAHGLFARALQKDASLGWALYGRGYANEKLGDKVSARTDYCTALAGAGGDTELSRELTGGLRRLGSGC